MEVIIIRDKIYEIRGQRVMLDFDLAALYEVPTKVLNQGVKRNAEHFPEDFMFRLTDKEWALVWSQIVTTSDENSSQSVISSKNRGKSYLPYAFTEHGVTMLASVLRSEKAAIYDAIENLLDERAAVRHWEDRERIGFKKRGS